MLARPVGLAVLLLEYGHARQRARVLQAAFRRLVELADDAAQGGRVAGGRVAQADGEEQAVAVVVGAEQGADAAGLGHGLRQAAGVRLVDDAARAPVEDVLARAGEGDAAGPVEGDGRVVGGEGPACAGGQDPVAQFLWLLGHHRTGVGGRMDLQVGFCEALQALLADVGDLVGGRVAEEGVRLRGLARVGKLDDGLRPRSADGPGVAGVLGHAQRLRPVAQECAVEIGHVAQEGLAGVARGAAGGLLGGAEQGAGQGVVVGLGRFAGGIGKGLAQGLRVGPACGGGGLLHAGGGGLRVVGGQFQGRGDRGCRLCDRGADPEGRLRGRVVVAYVTVGAGDLGEGPVPGSGRHAGGDLGGLFQQGGGVGRVATRGCGRERLDGQEGVDGRRVGGHGGLQGGPGIGFVAGCGQGVGGGDGQVQSVPGEGHSGGQLEGVCGPAELDPLLADGDRGSCSPRPWA